MPVITNWCKIFFWSFKWVSVQVWTFFQSKCGLFLSPCVDFFVSPRVDFLSVSPSVDFFVSPRVDFLSVSPSVDFLVSPIVGFLSIQVWTFCQSKCGLFGQSKCGLFVSVSPNVDSICLDEVVNNMSPQTITNRWWPSHDWWIKVCSPEALHKLDGTKASWKRDIFFLILNANIMQNNTCT